jgi:hypothetical protein
MSTMTYPGMNDCDHAILQVLQRNMQPADAQEWFGQWLLLTQSRRGLYDSIVAFANLLDETQGTQCSAWLRVLLLDAVLDVGQRRPAPQGITPATSLQ